MALPAYRVIYNWDGAPHGDGAPPQSMERFLEATFSPMKDTHADALFFSCGGHTAQYPSEVLPLVRDRSGRLYESVGAMIGGENVLTMIERGEDWQAAMIARGHELGIDVFASFRVNDNHFDGALLPQDAAEQDSRPRCASSTRSGRSARRPPRGLPQAGTCRCRRCGSTSMRRWWSCARGRTGTASRWTGSATHFTCRTYDPPLSPPPPTTPPDRS